MNKFLKLFLIFNLIFSINIAKTNTFINLITNYWQQTVALAALGSIFAGLDKQHNDKNLAIKNNSWFKTSAFLFSVLFIKNQIKN